MNNVLYNYFSAKIGFQPVNVSAFILIFTLTSCASIEMDMGSSPNFSALNSFTTGESTAAQIERVMGKPFETGQSLLPFQDKVTDSWTYFYEGGPMTGARQTFIFIYFIDGIFDGYMWFSSVPGQDNPDIQYWQVSSNYLLPDRHSQVEIF